MLLALVLGRLTSAADPPAPSTPTAEPPPPLLRAPPPPRPSLPPGTAAALRQLPALRPGMWEYERKLVGTASKSHRPESLKKCSDPRSEIRQKMEAMIRKGCRVLDMTRVDNGFRSSWNCLSDEGPLVISNLIRVDSPTSYEDDNESLFAQKTTRTVVVATRIGDCPAEGPPPPPVDIARPPDAPRP